MAKNLVHMEFLSAERAIVGRLIDITEQLLGYPYVRSDAVPAPDEAGEPFPGFDCMTYVESSLALAISLLKEDFKKNLLAIRYYNSIPSLSYRKHFAYLDWLRSNDWILEERNGFEGEVALVTKTINRKEFFDLKKIELPPFLKPIEQVVIPYIPLTGLISLVSEIYVVFFISGKDELDVEHMGFCVRKGKEYVLRHSSSVKGKVVEEPFIDYLYSSTNCIGVVFAIPKEDFSVNNLV